MKKLIFIFVLVLVIGTCFTASVFAEFYVIPVKKCGIKVTSAVVPKTGETQCYKADGIATGTCTCGDTDCTSGQDGEYQMGHTQWVVAPSQSNAYTVPNWTGDRFTDNNDGTINDNLTGLTWLKDAYSLSDQTDWSSALNYCNDLETAGHTDWRLPNFNELRSLADPSGETGPCLPSGHPFRNVQLNHYWSSTTIWTIDTTAAHTVVMNDGSQYGYNKDELAHVWPVRGGD